jgi:parallel beta-helix repeat protein
MKQICLLSLPYIFLVFGPAYAQVSLRLQDDLQIPSNTWVKIVPDTYRINDANSDGILRVANARNVIIDGDSVALHGAAFAGYGIAIENSDSVTIRNFKAVDSMFYAVRIRHSRHIAITNCNFSNNKRDDVGYIDVWTDASQALGGGVLMDSCALSSVSSSVMNHSNDGIALYYCDSIAVADNDLSWNTGFGVRMYWTNHCSVHDNNCSHTNRLTDQSDCGAILMIISNENSIERNDLTYSGDGIFLGQYMHHSIPNNNYFAYNDGSYSPHNAFEATFASGNVFKHNTANHSDYGFWLGYSFNTVVDSNEVNNNMTAGIAIDRGFHNSFRGDTIAGNPIGIWLWEGGEIPYYSDFDSHDYMIAQCILTSNGAGISASNTEQTTLRSDSIAYNANGVHCDGFANNDAFSGCSFFRNVQFHIENLSTNDIAASGNSFGTNDSALIEGKIFDRLDDPSRGTVSWKPFLAGPPPVFQLSPPADLAEPPSTWTVYASDGRSTTAAWDSTQKKSGSASLRVDTQSGFDVMAQFWPEGTKVAAWDLSGATHLIVWYRASNSNPFQAHSVCIGNESGGYFSYEATSDVLTNAVGTWRQYMIPLSGDATWQRTTHGAVSFSSISYVQVHADTWDSGFTLWIDGMSFYPPPNDVAEGSQPGEFSLSQNYPNPFNPTTKIQFTIVDRQLTIVNVFDLVGREVATLVNEVKDPGTYTVQLDGSNLASGMYIYRLEAGDRQISRRMLLLK